jgi:hypothetical protein
MKGLDSKHEGIEKRLLISAFTSGMRDVDYARALYSPDPE